VYCDFSIAVRSVVPAREYVSALAAELRARHSANQLDLATLYFGGGTPSKLGGEGVSRLVQAIAQTAHIRKDAEVTLEANPEDVSPTNVRAWKAAGVNRVSLGVQSFDDGVLRWMHRTHDAATAVEAVRALLDGGLSNISIDLIFATPQSLARDWRRDLDAALALDLPHLSLYGLTVESHTPLGRWVARKTTDEAPEERFESDFVDADRLLTSAGYDHYEVSNYGRTGFHSRHNWAYWDRKPYAGLGPSAHEFDGRVRRWNTAAYTGWLASIEEGRDSIEGSEALSPEQTEQESLYLGLRTSRGVPVDTPLPERFSRWVEAGWGTVAPDSRLRLRSSGWLRLDSIVSDLTAFRSRY
jgi:oxygen-independent coproporphyrinogen-3 oxidase